MNLMLAVVYETFTRIEKHKFRKLLLHRRAACDHAFRLLVSRTTPDRMAFRHFHGLMTFFRPTMSPLDCYLTFKTLVSENDDHVTQQQFYRLYEVMDLRWSRITAPEPAPVISRFSAAVIRWPGYEYVVHAVVAAGTFWQLNQAHTISSSSSFNELCNKNTTEPLPPECSYNTMDYLVSLQTSPITIAFVTLLTVDCAIRSLALGVRRYLADPWNRYECCVTIASLVGLAFALFSHPFTYVYVLRSVRLLRLFGLQRRYRDVMGTFMFILLRRFMSVLMVVLVVFYSFAILGVELFAGQSLMDCCKNTELEPYYRSNSSALPTGFYYLNNFDNLLISYVTLFQLMVANNWHIIMGGYAQVYTEWSRLYFMTFYIITMVVITIVVAFVLEAFLFRIQYKKKMGNIDRAYFGTFFIFIFVKIIKI
jgi:two pore calcium channel protein 1